MAASDSDTDENAINDVEGDLLESVYVYLMEGRGDSKSKEGDTKESSKL